MARPPYDIWAARFAKALLIHQPMDTVAEFVRVPTELPDAPTSVLRPRCARNSHEFRYGVAVLGILTNSATNVGEFYRD